MNRILEVTQVLWQPSESLATEGITCEEYLADLTWLLLLKVLPSLQLHYSLPIAYRWQSLLEKQGQAQLEQYRATLTVLSQSEDSSIKRICNNAHTCFTQPSQLINTLTALVVIDTLAVEELGELYESLLERCAHHHTHYFMPPRALTDALVILLQPQWGEIVHDPCASTGSFLVAAAEYTELIRKDETKRHSPTISPPVFLGTEDTNRYRFACMNCLLHQQHLSSQFDIEAQHAFSRYEKMVGTVDVLLSLLLPTIPMADTLTESLELLEYTIRALKPGGRAGVIVTDDVLSAKGHAQQVRHLLLETCVLHTVLRLPLHTFHPHVLATQVLFFYRGRDKTERTHLTWFYDLRSGQSVLPLPLSRECLLPFEKAFGDNPLGQSSRQEEGDNGRWRCFDRKLLVQEDGCLDICWLQALDTPENHLHQIVNNTIQELEILVTILSNDL